jgi:hypothetical protein
MMHTSVSNSIFNLTGALSASLWPSNLKWFVWLIIIIVLYLVNVLISARMLYPVGLPESKKPGRMKHAFLLALVLSWPMVYLIVLMLSEMGGEESNTMGILGAMFAWIFFIVIDFIANWKIMEMYFPIRQTLGGSDAYANLHRHMWGHLLALVGVVIAALGTFIWHVMR